MPGKYKYEVATPIQEEKSDISDISDICETTFGLTPPTEYCEQFNLDCIIFTMGKKETWLGNTFNCFFEERKSHDEYRFNPSAEISSSKTINEIIAKFKERTDPLMYEDRKLTVTRCEGRYYVICLDLDKAEKNDMKNVMMNIMKSINEVTPLADKPKADIKDVLKKQFSIEGHIFEPKKESQNSVLFKTISKERKQQSAISEVLRFERK